jgi:hypothetical protein
MPSPKVRAKRLRDTLTEAEEIELVLGSEPGHPSLFTSGAERAEARALLARIQEDRDPFEALLARYPVDRERRRRHMAAGHPGTDPDYPDVHDARDCRLCNPQPSQGGTSQ